MKALLERFAAAVSVAPRYGGTATYPDAPRWQQGTPWTQTEMQQGFPHAFRVVGTVYRCVSMIQNDVAALPVRFYQGEGKQRTEIARAKGNIVDVWSAANERDTDYELARNLQGSLDVSGNGYLFLDRMGTGKVREITSLPGHWVEPIPGPRRTVLGFLFGPDRAFIEADSIIHFRMFNPEDEPTGLSPLEAVRHQYGARYNASRWNEGFYRKGPQIAGVFSADAQAPMDDKTVDEAKRALRRRYGGIDNMYDPVFLQGWKFDKMGVTHAEMQFLETAKLTDADICGVYGIPPGLMSFDTKGVLSDAGAKTHAIQYVLQSLKPRCDFRDRVMNERFCPLFGPGISMVTDLRQHPYMQSAMLDQMQALSTAAGGAIISVNSAHEWLGIPPDPNPESDGIRQGPAAPALPTSEPAGKGAQTAPTDERGAPKAIVHRAALMVPGREALRRQANANLRRYEGKFERGFVALFDAQQKRCVAAAQAQKHGAKAMSAIAVQIEDQIQPSDEDQKALDALFAELVQERGDEALADLGLEMTLNMHNRRAAEFVRSRSSKALSQTSETTTNLLRERLAQVTAEGGTFADVLQAINAVFDARRANAVTIARTETAGAYNGATWYAWQQSGQVQAQEWLTVGDELVREAHAALDGQTASLEEGWPAQAADGSVVNLMYPGDPNGPPDLTVNCRCVAQPVLSDEVQAMKPQRNGHGGVKLTNRVARWLTGAGV